MATNLRIDDPRSTLPPVLGAVAPDLTLSDETGQYVRLSEHWSAAPRGLLLVFVRQLG